MKKKGYTVGYKLEGEKKWTIIKNVVQRNLDDLATSEEREREGYRFTNPKYWVFTTASKNIFMVPVGCLLRYYPDQVEFTHQQMQKETGQIIPLAE